MLSRLLLLILLIFTGLPASGQEAYRVVFAGGRSYVAGDNQFSKLNAGQKIDGQAELELVGNSRVVLMDEAGRLISLGLTGRYKLEDLKMTASGDSSQFIKSVWDQYFRRQDAGLPVQEALLARDAGLGFELSIPSSSQFFGHRQIIEWPHLSKQGYEIRLINEFGEVFETINQIEARLNLDLLQQDMVWKTEVTIQVYRADNGQRSPLHTLSKLSPPDYEDMDRLLKREFSGVQFEVLLTKAAYFENLWLFADAQTMLHDLSKEYGNLMDDFWKSYLFRNGFYAMSRE